MSGRDYLTQTELMVMLAVLRLGEEAHGVPISAEIRSRTRRQISAASVYAVLERLEQQELVASALGSRAKTYFQLTAKGLAQLSETQRALRHLWRGLPQLKGEPANSA